MTYYGAVRLYLWLRGCEMDISLIGDEVFKLMEYTSLMTTSADPCHFQRIIKPPSITFAVRKVSCFVTSASYQIAT